LADGAGGTSEPCSRSGLINESVATAIDAKRAADTAAVWLKSLRRPPEPHPLEAELEKIQKVLDAVEECLPVW